MGVNPLPAIVRILPSGWAHPLDVLPVVGFQMKLAGVDWRTDMQLIAIIELLVEIGLLERRMIDVEPHFQIRVNPHYKEKQSEASTAVSTNWVAVKQQHDTHIPVERFLD